MSSGSNVVRVSVSNVLISLWASVRVRGGEESGVGVGVGVTPKTFGGLSSGV